MLNKKQKKQLVQKLREKIKENKLIVVCNFEGLSVEKQKEFKKNVKRSGSEVFVIKRRLLEKAFLEENINFPKIGGSIMIIFGKDEILPAKIAYQFIKSLSSKKEKFEFIGGVINNEKEYQTLSKDELVEIALLPSREELLRRLIGTLSAPLSNFINVLQGNLKGLIQVLTTIKSS